MASWTDEQIDWYAEKYGEDPTNAWVADAANLTGVESVLDVGCGTGSALRHLAGNGHTGALAGADPYPRMIAHARQRSAGAEIRFVVAGAESLPFEDGSFDAVLAINSVHHWNDIGKGLAEMARVLKPGGSFCLGGERFDKSVLPEGQDYSKQLKEQGFSVSEESILADGRCFVCRALKAGRDV